MPVQLQAMWRTGIAEIRTVWRTVSAAVDNQAPMCCLVIAFLLTIAMLRASGYFALPKDEDDYARVIAALGSAFLKGRPEHFEVESVAAFRGGLAVSGVLLAATVAMSMTAVLWVSANMRGRPWRFVLSRLAGLIMGLEVLAWVIFSMPLHEDSFSFISRPAYALLDVTRAQFPNAEWLGSVPLLMLCQAVGLPLILAFGACLFMQPVPRLVGDRIRAQKRIETLIPRVRELDQMLYIGALALVCGTLQLAAALSVPLLNMPAAADVKTTIDLCKASTSEKVANPFFSVSHAAAEAPGMHSPATASFHREFSAGDCEAVQTELARVSVAQSVRSLIHALTLALGLAFSMLLAAIYVPAMIRLRVWMDEARELGASANASDGSDFGNADPMRRIAATIATLGPIIAGLVANTLTSN